jgi:hypothetical protein
MGEPNKTLVAHAYEQLTGAVWQELRRACEMHGVTYPAQAEREMREYYRREIRWEVQ